MKTIREYINEGINQFRRFNKYGFWKHIEFLHLKKDAKGNDIIDRIKKFTPLKDENEFFVILKKALNLLSKEENFSRVKEFVNPVSNISGMMLHLTKSKLKIPCYYDFDDELLSIKSILHEKKKPYFDDTEFIFNESEMKKSNMLNKIYNILLEYDNYMIHHDFMVEKVNNKYYMQNNYNILNKNIIKLDM